MVDLPHRILAPVLRHQPRRGMILSLFTANLLWLQLTYSQRAYTSFGPVSELSLGFSPAGLAIRSAPALARNEVAVLAQFPSMLHFFALNDSGRIVPTGECPVSAPRIGLVAADLDGDGEPEFLSLHPDGTELSVLKRNGRTYSEKVYPTPARGQKLAVADVNNDGVPDILLYGKSMAGVATMLGRAGGGFSPGPELFNEISVSGLIALDLNGDGIMDVVVVNWLSNELTFFYGISRMVFSEQLAVQLPGEPENLAFTWMQKRRSYGLAVSLPAAGSVALVRGTSDGDVQVEGTVPLAGRPSALAFADVNDDAIPDLLVSTARGTAVALGSGDFTFLPPVIFGPGASPVWWGPADLDSDRRTDLAVAGQDTRRLVFLGNSRHAGRAVWPATYAVGSAPESVSLVDINGDGLTDIAVANNRSASVSLLMNRGWGSFDGQLSVPVPDQPVRVIASSPGGTERLILTSHPRNEKIGVVSWGERAREPRPRRSPPATFRTPSMPGGTGTNSTSLSATALTATTRCPSPCSNKSADASSSKGIFAQASRPGSPPSPSTGRTRNPTMCASFGPTAHRGRQPSPSPPRDATLPSAGFARS